MRDDPDSEENQAASRQNEREVFALQMQAKADAECTHDELDHGICLYCGADCSESLEGAGDDYMDAKRDAL